MPIGQKVLGQISIIMISITMQQQLLAVTGEQLMLERTNMPMPL
jgi:hypothetical protein